MAVVALKEKYFTKTDFYNSYDCGGNFRFLKIRSANDKGRRNNSRRLLKDALEYPYIQPNSDYNISWLVFDIDRDFDTNDIFDKKLPMPNFIVFNKENGHAQVWYKLKEPVWIQDKFKNRAYKYYMAVYNAMRDALDADRHFNRALCKNPFFFSDGDKNAKWVRCDFCWAEYSLLELRNHLDINSFSDTDKKNTSVSVDFDLPFCGAAEGCRNSSLFDFCRKAAYKYFSSSNCSENELLNWTEKYIENQNENNAPPLSPKECEAMAKSIATWTFNNIQVNAKKYKRYDAAAREKSLKTRIKNKNKKIAKIKRFLKKNPNISNREIARRFGYSVDSVNSYIKTIQAQQKQMEIARKNKSVKKENASFSSFLNPFNERFVNQFVCGATGNLSGNVIGAEKWTQHIKTDGLIFIQKN